MIDIRVYELTARDEFDKLEVMLPNTLATTTADAIRHRLKDKKCSDHPDATNVLTVVAVRDKAPTIEKTRFCCKDFSDSITFTFTS